MLGIDLSNVGHAYGAPGPRARWLFRGLGFALPPGGTLVVQGPNGAGKSTLLRLLAGQLAPREGRLAWHLAGQPVAQARVYAHLGWAAPYVEPYGALTLGEALALHFRFKGCALAGGVPAVLAALGLTAQASQPLRALSSGQGGRLRLGLALFSPGALLLLDEPTANMDDASAAAALALLAQHRGGRTLVLASNLPREVAGLPGLRLSLGGAPTLSPGEEPTAAPGNEMA